MASVDSDVASDEDAASGIAVTYSNKKGIRASVAAVIGYRDAVGDSRSVAQMCYATQVGAVPIECKSPNVRVGY